MMSDLNPLSNIRKFALTISIYRILYTKTLLTYTMYYYLMVVACIKTIQWYIHLINVNKVFNRNISFFTAIKKRAPRPEIHCSF